MERARAEVSRAGPVENQWRSWMVVGLLASCYALSHLDRQIISLLVRPIKASLDLSDTQFGVLQGFSFSFFHAIATFPLAWLADRSRRSRLMSACVASWSAMTLCCGLATTFVQLMLARIGVAVGEAGLGPAALATISDRFDRRRVATASAIYMLAPFVGGGVAYWIGGVLYTWTKTLSPDSLLIQLGFQDWQIVFLVVGATGIVPALLLLLVADRPVAPKDLDAKGRLWEVFALFRKEWRIYVSFSFAIAMVLMVLSAYVSWLPAAIMRSKGVNEATVGALFGPTYLICGITGTISAGLIITMSKGGDPVGATLRYMSLVSLILWPLATFGLMTSSLAAELTMMGISLFLISSLTALSPLPFQFLPPRHLRAQSIALMLMLSAIFGAGLGPVFAGYLSDVLQSARYPLSTALSLIAGVSVPITLLLLQLTLREHQRRRTDLAD